MNEIAILYCFNSWTLSHPSNREPGSREDGSRPYKAFAPSTRTNCRHRSSGRSLSRWRSPMLPPSLANLRAKGGVCQTHTSLFARLSAVKRCFPAVSKGHNPHLGNCWLLRRALRLSAARRTYARLETMSLRWNTASNDSKHCRSLCDWYASFTRSSWRVSAGNTLLLANSAGHRIGSVHLEPPLRKRPMFLLRPNPSMSTLGRGKNFFMNGCFLHSFTPGLHIISSKQ